MTCGLRFDIAAHLTGQEACPTLPVAGVHLLPLVPAEVPAGRIAEMREQRIHTLLRRRRVERVCGLAVFRRDHPCPLHDHTAELLTAVRNPKAQRGVIARIDQRDRQKDTEDRIEQYLFQILRNSLRLYIQYRMSQ